MKFHIFFIAAVIGLFLGTGIALASQGTGSHADPSVPVPALEAPTSLDIPAAPEVIQVHEFTIVASVPQHAVAKTTRHWVCGEMQDLYTGGRAATCEWR